MTPPGSGPSLAADDPEEESTSRRAADRFKIFETVALERLQAGTDLTKPAAFLPLPVRLTAIAGAAIAGLGVLWSIRARVPVQVNGTGVLVCNCTNPRSELRTLEAPTTGILYNQVSGYGRNSLPEQQQQYNQILREIELGQKGSSIGQVYEMDRLTWLVGVALAPISGQVLNLSAEEAGSQRKGLHANYSVVSYPGTTVLARIEDRLAKAELHASLNRALPAESVQRQQRMDRIKGAEQLGNLDNLQHHQRFAIEKELSQRRELYQRYLNLWKQGVLPVTTVMEEQSRINALESQLLSANSTQVNTRISRNDQIEQSKQALVSSLEIRNRLQNQLIQYIDRTTVFAPAQGVYILSRNFFNGSFVRQGQELFTYTTTPPYLPSTIPVFLDAAAAQQVSAGMSVLLTPKGISRAQYGGIPGKVIEVSKHPLDDDGLKGVLQSRAMVGPIQQLFPTPYMIRVRLEKLNPVECNQAGSANCYRWSSGRQPSQPVRIATLADAQITTIYRHPIEFVMPSLRRVLGLVEENK